MKKITLALAAAEIALSCISMGVQAADGTAAGDPGRDWRIALYNAEKKGQPDQNQDIHLSAQQKADVESNKDAVQKADVNDVHQLVNDFFRDFKTLTEKMPDLGPAFFRSFCGLFPYFLKCIMES